MWKLYVGNLSSRIREMEIANEFRAYGLVRSVWIAKNPPGYAFVEFDSRQEAYDAIAALDGKHGWRVEMSRKSTGGGRPKSPSHDRRCRDCGSRHHHTRDCCSRASSSSRRGSKPPSRTTMSRNNPKGRLSRSRSPQRENRFSERYNSPKHQLQSPKLGNTRSLQKIQDNPRTIRSRSPQRYHDNSPRKHDEFTENNQDTLDEGGVHEDGLSLKSNSSRSQNYDVSPQQDEHHAPIRHEDSLPSKGNYNSSENIENYFQTDGKYSPAASEGKRIGSPEHMITGESPSP